jgi:hypothetical protein
VFNIKDITAHKNVLNTRVSYVLHKAAEGLAQGCAALVTLIGAESDIGRIEMQVAAMQEF